MEETLAVQTEQTGQSAEKTFTQKELDDIVQQRLARERKNQPNAEELDEFRKWREVKVAQKPAEEKQPETRAVSDELKAAKDAQIAAEQKAAELEAKFTAIKKGVAADAAEDVVALAKGKVSDNVTLEAAIDEVLKKYPQFGGAAVTTGAKIHNGGGVLSGVEAAFYAKDPLLKSKT